MVVIVESLMQKVMVVTQPGFLHWSGDRYQATVTQKQLPYLYRLGSLEAMGVPLAGGSDAPITWPQPLLAMATACTRLTASGHFLLSEESLPNDKALSLFTTGAAKSVGWNKQLGTIKPGNLADLVVLNRDPFVTKPEDWAAIDVLLTISRGKIAWEK